MIGYCAVTKGARAIGMVYVKPYRIEDQTKE